MKIIEAVQGSGYWDIHTDDNAWHRVEDGSLPSGYEPSEGDTLEIGEDGPVFAKAE